MFGREYRRESSETIRALRTVDIKGAKEGARISRARLAQGFDLLHYNLTAAAGDKPRKR